MAQKLLFKGDNFFMKYFIKELNQSECQYFLKTKRLQENPEEKRKRCSYNTFYFFSLMIGLRRISR